MPKKTGPPRRYEDDFKRKVVLEAAVSDISVTEVARRHGLNANLVFNWRKKFGAGSTLPQSETPAPECQLVPVEVKPDDPPQSTEFALRQGADPDRDPSEHSGPAQITRRTACLRSSCLAAAGCAVPLVLRRRCSGKL